MKRMALWISTILKPAGNSWMISGDGSGLFVFIFQEPLIRQLWDLYQKNRKIDI
jgi:hypothetical protein